MKQNLHEADRILVEQCLSGSPGAWDEFYVQFLPLVQKAVSKNILFRGADLEDVVQNVFLTLYTDLKHYDSRYAVSKFIWVVAKQVCVDEYRRATASKRTGKTVAVDHHDSGQEAATTLKSALDLPEDQLERSEQLEILKRAFTNIGEKCRELLQLRYLEELPFKEIATLLGANKKSLAVQAGRCLDELRGTYADAEREGLEP